MRQALRRGWPLLALVLALLWMQWRLWHGAGGWPDVLVLREQVELQGGENARLEQRNATLAAEVEDLKSGEAAVEERARSELGMIKPGETFYRVIEPQEANGTSQPPPAGGETGAGQ
jgi:cell division protein FtsB